MKRSGVFIILGALLGALFLSGIPCGVNEAFAVCKDPYNPNNYTTCFDCYGTCGADVNGDGTVTATDVQLVYRCWKTAGCKKYDLNGDGVVNQIDYDIVRRCTGCCSTPSPIR